MTYQYKFLNELIIDSFAGGGGASTGIELALGRIVDIAINHDIKAIQMHEQNHPYTKHYCENVFDVDPLIATQGRPVGLFWLSPDCTHFSRAKGGKPVKKEIRGLAWIAVEWAKKVKPRVIMLENVPEFQTWGPIDDNGQPIKELKGETFHEFVNSLKCLGYQVEWQVIVASDFGAPTDRKRLYLIARCDGQSIVWPSPTHGTEKGLSPKRTAAECIDFTIPGKSIFGRQKPLAIKTMKRIARGLDKFTIKNKMPFIIPVGYGEAPTQAPRVNDIKNPLGTLVSTIKHNLVEPKLTPLPTITTGDHNVLVTPELKPYVASFHFDNEGSNIDEPLPTITSKDRMSLIENHLCILRNNMDCKPLDKPLSTITASPGHFVHVKTYLLKYQPGTELYNWPQIRTLLNEHCGYHIANDEVLILEIDSVKYFIGDIDMRMLVPKKLFRCQGFPVDYKFEFDVDGKPYPKTEQVKRVGNSVCPPVPKALVKANLPELCINKKLNSMKELIKELV